MSSTIVTVAPGPLGSVAEWVRAAEGWARIGAAIVRVPGGRDLVRELREATGLVVQAAADVDADLVSCPVDPDAHRRLRDAGLVPAYRIADPGALTRLLAEHGPPHGGHVHGELVLAPGEGTARRLLAAVEALPAGATFSAAGRGTAGLPVMLASLSAGGHLTVGRELTDEYAPGEPVRDDGQLVARAAGLARIAQRPPASPAKVRALLGLRPAG